MSIESCKRMIEVVTKWLSSQTSADIDKLTYIGYDFERRLSTLGELVAMGSELGKFRSLKLDDFETVVGCYLSALPTIYSIDDFNDIPAGSFDSAIMYIKQTLQKLDPEQILWEIINFKRKELVEKFGKIITVKEIAGLTKADTALILDFINKPYDRSDPDILIWSVNHTHTSITLYLVRSILKEKTTTPPDKILLDTLSISEALIAAIKKKRISN